MKKILLFLTLSMLTNTYSQERVVDNKVYYITDVDKEPEYVDGMDKFYMFMARNFKVPSKEGLKGVIILQFIIEKDGSTSNLKAIIDIGYGSGEEAKRVFKKSKNWFPGKKDGQVIRTLYQVPITISST